MIIYLFSTLINVLITVLSIVSVAFVAYSLFTVGRQWNKKDNQDLFNLLLVSSVFLIIVRIIDLIIKRNSYYFFRPVASLILIILVIALPAIIYALTIASGHTIYEPGYLNKLSNTEFLKSEIMESFGLFMREIEKIAAKFSKDTSAGANRPGQAQKMSTNGDLGANAYKYTEDAGDYKGMLKENRSLLLFILLNIITCGIYSFYFIHTAARDANIACSGDGDHTSGLLKYIILSFITCGIYSIYWDYALANRLAANGSRYGYTIQENGSTYLLWLLLGWWICGLGIFVARNITIKNLNKICRGYNQKNPIF